MYALRLKVIYETVKKPCRNRCVFFMVQKTVAIISHGSLTVSPSRSTTGFTTFGLARVSPPDVRLGPPYATAPERPAVRGLPAKHVSACSLQQQPTAYSCSRDSPLGW